jgi:subtilisin-like proprotein convertase family protein
MNGVGANDNLYSNNQGMGEVNLNSYFDIFSTTNIIRDQLAPEMFTATGQSRAFTGNIVDNTKPFRVTLAWTDAPGSTAGNAFVNNLDLEVTVGGQIFKGNVFTGANSATGGSADPRNNVESVLIPAGVTGPFLVRVKASNIAGDGVPGVGANDQDFALVISNALAVNLAFTEAAGATITAEGCPPANGALDPGETVTVDLCVLNVGTANTVNLVGTLQATGGVTSPSGPQTYGVVNAGGPAVCRPFTFTANGACGGTVTASLQLQDGATNLGTVTFTFQLGAAGPPSVTNFSSGNIAVPIPDAGSVEVPISVSNTGVVGDVNVSVRLNHTFDEDLVISLVHPDGTTVTLAQNRGEDLNNFGTGTNDCAGTPTVFDDGAATPISGGTAPFAGTFIPETPLSALNGKPVNGIWKLRVQDTAAIDVGTIGCVTFHIGISQILCCPATIIPVPPPVLTAESCTPNNAVVDPDETVTMNFSLANLGPANTTALTATLQSTGGVTAPSGPQNYGVLVAAGPAVARPFTFTASTTCGGVITATFTLQDGAFNLGTASFTIPTGVVSTATATFTNSTAITIPNPPSTGTATGAPSNPYPSNITVSGVTGTVTKVTASLNAFSHTFPDDVDVMMVGPTGVRILLMSDVGGSIDAVSANLTFDDAAAAAIPDAGPTVTGTFKPSNVGGGDAFPAPAPAPPADPQLLSTFNGLDPNGTWALFVVDDLGGDIGSLAGGWSITITTSTTTCCVAASCTITCPANVTQSNDPNQCGAVVNYPAPTTTGTCGTVSCSPASGSFFPVGTTTVNCTTSAGPTCSFTVTVADTQPPTLGTCPTGIGGAPAAPGATCVNVTFSTPTASDNCPGVSISCNPPSGTCFPLGITTVTCTATDAAGNTASCSFPVTVFNVRLQDDSKPANVILWNSQTGAYCATANGQSFSGTGVATKTGSIFKLTVNTGGVRIDALADGAANKGQGSIQKPVGTMLATIKDSVLTNDTATCQ